MKVAPANLQYFSYFPCIFFVLFFASYCLVDLMLSISICLNCLQPVSVV
jgi:hypothetical protein